MVEKLSRSTLKIKVMHINLEMEDKNICGWIIKISLAESKSIEDGGPMREARGKAVETAVEQLQSFLDDILALSSF